jgi:hypothetical protein
MISLDPIEIVGSQEVFHRYFVLYQKVVADSEKKVLQKSGTSHLLGVDLPKNKSGPTPVRTSSEYLRLPHGNLPLRCECEARNHIGPSSSDSIRSGAVGLRRDRQASGRSNPGVPASWSLLDSLTESIVLSKIEGRSYGGGL